MILRFDSSPSDFLKCFAVELGICKEGLAYALGCQYSRVTKGVVESSNESLWLAVKRLEIYDTLTAWKSICFAAKLFRFDPRSG